MPKAKSATTPKPKTTRAKKSSPTHEEIALRAYHIFLERNGAPGDPHSDWLRAEAELTAPTKPKRAPRKSKVVPIAA